MREEELSFEKRICWVILNDNFSPFSCRKPPPLLIKMFPLIGLSLSFGIGVERLNPAVQNASAPRESPTREQCL